MKSRRRLSAAALARSRDWYLWTVIAGGATLIVGAAADLLRNGVDPRWWILAVITGLSAWARLRMPKVPISFSIADSFTIATALLFGPSAGIIVVALEGFVVSLRITHTRSFVQRMLFNTAAPALAMGCAAWTFFTMAGVEPLVVAVGSVGALIVPLAAFAAAFFLVNTGLVAIAIGCDQKVSPIRLWREHFVGLWLTYFGGAAVAALMIALVHSRQQEFLILTLVAPIPFILYATFKSVVGRMEDRVEHLDEVTRMHLATIETLAHAIDAKDQVTHGHIRRVQHYAVGLAKDLGVADDDLRAIEAASLLHDIGKLAVPEHILNKPGPLTPAEFDQMKQHARIGAEMLAMVNFPFPVVPLVRHHHENWDGSGYPDGLASETIPLGARILSVVDCFDAITSDRPYRQAMPLDQALKTLRGRSGTMYDPRVVERFIALQPTLAGDLPGTLERAFETITHAARGMSETAAATAAERDIMAGLFELGRAMGATTDAVPALTAAHGILRRLLPAATSALYVLDPASDTLVVATACGVHGGALKGLAIPRGQRLTGWVAANRRTIVNSDAALDLGNLVVTLQPTPVACLSSPVALNGEVMGVLTIYSASREPFTSAHETVVEVAASGLAQVTAELYARSADGRAPLRGSSALRLVGGGA